MAAGTSSAKNVSTCSPAGTSVHSVSRGMATEAFIMTSTAGFALPDWTSAACSAGSFSRETMLQEEPG